VSNKARKNSPHSDAQLGRINVLYHGASGGMYVSRAVSAFRPLARRDRRCDLKFPLRELFLPGSLLNQNEGVGSNWVEAHYTKAWNEFR
jgi:hypothetical protein